jgi:hypothetical protein
MTGDAKLRWSVSLLLLCLGLQTCPSEAHDDESVTKRISKYTSGLLENFFASGPDFHSSVERAVLGRFQPDSGALIGPAATFATGSHLPSSSSNATSACGHLAPFRCLSDILAYKHPLEAQLCCTVN